MHLLYIYECCHAAVGPPGPSAANCVAMDGPLCRKWSPTSKPAQARVDKTVAGIPKERSDCLVKVPCTFVAMANGE